MQTIVYFSNNGIQVLQGNHKGGQLKIYSFRTLSVEEGALINGVIVNEEAIKTVLKEVLEENKDAFKNMTLLIDSSLIMTKNSEVPKLKPKALSEIARKEFEDTAGNYENLIVDYSLIPGKNGQNIFCCAVEKQFLEVYIEVFKSLNIKIDRIDVGLNAMIQYISETKDYKKMTFALNVLEGNNLVSILFENGIYIFSTRSRLMAKRGTEGFISELATRLSSLIQFNKSQKSEYSLAMSLYGGLKEDELEALKSLVFDPELKLFIIPKTPNITEEFNIDETFDFGVFINSITGFFAGKKSINLMREYHTKSINKKEIKIEYKVMILPIGLLLIVLGFFIFFLIQNYGLQKDLDEMNAYINDEKNKEAYAEFQSLSNQITTMNNAIINIEIINSTVSGYPRLVSEKLYRMEELCNSVIALNNMTYDNITGDISVMATADNEQEAALYVQRLKETGYFTQIGYIGYSEVEMSKTQTDTTTTPSTTTPATTTGTTTTAAMTTPGISTSTITTTTSTGYAFIVNAYLKAGESL